MKKKKIIDLTCIEDFLMSGVNAIALVSEPAIEVNFIAFKKEISETDDITNKLLDEYGILADEYKDDGTEYYTFKTSWSRQAELYDELLKIYPKPVKETIVEIDPKLEDKFIQVTNEEFKKWRSKPESANVEEIFYNDETFDLVIKFHGGGIYTYPNTNFSLFRDIFEGNGVCRTEGSNKWSSWYVGKTPSVGAAVYEKLVETGANFIEGGSFEYNRIKLQPFQMETIGDQHILVGPSMVPDMEILRKDENGDPFYVQFSKEAIAKIAEKFMKEQTTWSTNQDHNQETPADTYIFESWIVEDSKTDKINTVYGFDLPVGTWCVKMRVNNEDVWNRVKNGELKGFSVEGDFVSEEDLEALNHEMKLLEMIKNIVTQ